MAEKAFEGTVLEGRERRYTVINEKDIAKYGDKRSVEKMEAAIDNVLIDVQEGRIKDGKKPFNSYIIINLDEPYIDEVIEIMKKYGHFEK